jgi:AcrR family transcriptional regulator
MEARLSTSVARVTAPPARNRTPRLPAAQRGAGRPRDPRLDAKVLASTRRLLRRVGYNRLTIEAVARDAGIHRPAIYRRWRSKADLVHEAVYPADDRSRRIVLTGDIARDLRACVRATIALFTRPEVRAALPGLMADYWADPRLQSRLVARMGTAARTSFARVLDAARGGNDVVGSARADILFDALSGSIVFRILMSGLDGIAGLEDELTGLLLAGAGVADLAAARSPARRRSPRSPRARPARA